MNWYFLLEGEETEPKFYPAVMQWLRPEFQQVDMPSKAIDKNYYVISGGGIPQILNHFENAIKDINEKYSQFTHLFICVDAEELTVEQRIKKFQDKITEKNLLSRCKIHYVVQNACIETWFLGNSRVCSSHPQNQPFINFKNFFDVSENNPELMPAFKIKGYDLKADFHHDYLVEMLKEHNNPKGFFYRKNNPVHVIHPSYLMELKNRAANASKHLSSFKNFIDLISTLK